MSLLSDVKEEAFIVVSSISVTRQLVLCPVFNPLIQRRLKDEEVDIVQII